MKKEITLQDERSCAMSRMIVEHTSCILFSL